jgi:hypothetical protein
LENDLLENDLLLIPHPMAQYFVKCLTTGRCIVFVAHDTKMSKVKLDVILKGNGPVNIVTDVLHGVTETIAWTPVGFNLPQFEAKMNEAGFTKLSERKVCEVHETN